jgi:hypothetical protein
MDTIQINKFSSLHNGNTIIFCKTDYIFAEFENIKKIPNNVTLITGNSDYPIDDYRFSQKPENITKWFGQNILVNDDCLIPIPIGLENKLESVRTGHGIGYYDRVNEKEFLLSRQINKTPSKKYYANFNISTNYDYRSKIKKICLESPHIDWEESNLSLTSFFDKILDYEAIICPIGNGIDTHRLWETLYSNRIPIIIKVGNYKIYELYEKLPIIILENENQLYDETFLDNKLKKIKNNKYDMSLLDMSYWHQKILNT